MKVVATSLSMVAFFGITACGTTHVGKIQDRISILDESGNTARGAGILADEAAIAELTAQQMDPGSKAQRSLAVVSGNNAETAAYMSSGAKNAARYAEGDLRDLTSGQDE
tara:strand:+ start:84 stop:413 length:330 start_codon:yes stop_codon:yes gene_type:complete